MNVIKTKLDGVLVLEPELYSDNRGWFTESYSKKEFEKAGLFVDFVQDNRSKSIKAGTIRGLHFQNKPMGQSKLVYCTKGAILDVAVDLRKDSKTYKQWVSVVLSEINKKQIFIPVGFAHGFISLEDNSDIYYKVDNYYSKEHDMVIRYDDKELGVDWKLPEKVIVSDKDFNAPYLYECKIDF